MENTISIQYFETPFGELILGSYNQYLVLCDWRYRKMRTNIDQRIQITIGREYKEESSDIINKTISQLSEYFNGLRRQFNINYKLIGTNFQKSVWKELLEIPYGKTSSYLQLAEKIKNPEAYRAVAAANGANALSIIVPCHRIIGCNGKLVGYAGGLSAKKKLLSLEGYKITSMQTELFET